MGSIRKISFSLLTGAMLLTGVGQAQQDAKAKQDIKTLEMVRLATQTELEASANDHSHWEYKDSYRSPDGEKLMRVVETGKGALKKVVERDGLSLTPEELKQEDARLESFVNNPAQQAKQHRDNVQDDKRAESMLRMLPEAFVWKAAGEDAKTMTLAFTPDPKFTPPTMESRVFAAMAGEIVVDKAQHRIVTIKGKLTDDVKFGFGFFGRMKQGGTFEVVRRQLAPGIWQIAESHVHIDGKALLFKSIGEQEDDVKSEFRRVPAEETLEQAAMKLRGEPASLSAQQQHYGRAGGPVAAFFGR